MMDRLPFLKERIGPMVQREELRDNVRYIVPADAVHETLKILKEEQGFDMLAELAGVDYLNYPHAQDRFGVIYGLTNVASGERVFVKTYVNEPDPELPTVTDLWAGADWLEREVYDMFGIRFTGHPDLRRILMPEGAECFPLRKDYPLRGLGERHNLPRLTRAEG